MLSQNNSKLESLYIYIYIYISPICLLSLISSHSLCPIIHLLCPSKLTFHDSPAWEMVSRILPVTSGDFFIELIHIWYEYQGDEIALSTYNVSYIVNWYRNRSVKTSSSYILLFGHGRQLNSTVSNHEKQLEIQQNEAIIVEVSVSYAITSMNQSI